MNKPVLYTEEPSVLSVHFSENAEEEIHTLMTELRLHSLLKLLSTDAESREIPENLKKDLRHLTTQLVDMFSLNLPTLHKTPEETLRAVSRDVNLSRWLRERGIMRLYLLVNSRKEVNIFDENTGEILDAYTVQTFQTLNNPYTESPFKTQEEFVNWFCKEASVSRATIYLRFYAYNRLIQYFEYPAEEAFKILTSKPSVIIQTLRSIATWSKDTDVVHIDPDVALRLAERHNGNMLEEAKELVAAIKDDGTTNIERYSLERDLIDLVKPAFRDAIEEVAAHDNVHDASELVNIAILNKPEISYWWDEEVNSLRIQLVIKQLNEDTGEESIVNIESILLLPDTRDALPEPIIRDLLERLPIRNRESLTTN